MARRAEGVTDKLPLYFCQSIGYIDNSSASLSLKYIPT